MKNLLSETKQRQFHKKHDDPKDDEQPFLMLLSPDNSKMTFGTNRWNTEKMLTG